MLCPTGVFHAAEKLEKRTCAFCPKGHDYSVLYFAPTKNIAAHENCLLYSSALVECEDHDSFNHDRNFDVQSVKKEIQRGKKLKCTFCKERGATVGCDEKRCTKNYHFFCAKSDHAVPLSDNAKGTYKVFCREHAFKLPAITPSGKFPKFSIALEYRPYRTLESLMFFNKSVKSSSHSAVKQPLAYSSQGRKVEEEHGRDTDAILKVTFLKKCKEAGLLNDLFVELSGKLHSMQDRLLEGTASESDYEEIGTTLLDSRLFQDTFVNFQTALDNEIDQSEKRQQQLKGELELLQDLKQTLWLLQESKGLGSRTPSLSSLSCSG
ncbi:PREDICTED: PHD finger protein 11 [Elephantulus edwardii]|uniref:PHD finger protein 11 n=1 Tax=Elephantulus edwardii TaxID=28737 RepID=UPI0003F0A687|nr:PREDICTED: PHD finger protein 11 [Elephantulus edwardii]